MAKDSICGMFVEETAGALKATVRGKTYYFCSETCIQTFLAPEIELKNLKQMAALSFILGIPSFLIMWFFMFPYSNIVLFALATPVQFIAGWRFYKGFWHALKARSANMDTLIAIGISSL